MRIAVGLMLSSLALSSLIPAGAQSALGAKKPVEVIAVNTQDRGTPLPHFWEEMFGSGQAILALRDSYRKDLRAAKAITGFRYVRFHDILDDQVGIYMLDKGDKDKGDTIKPPFNYSYVDQIYDGLLADGVRPFVELGFMPEALAAKKKPSQAWYEPNASPPKDYAIWDDMIRGLVRHLVERYGIDEVSQWYFEVWNEPDDVFPEPKQALYFEFYDHTARDVKSIDSRLRVGGPATSSADWVAPFLDHCHKVNAPVDFVSTHIYGDGSTELAFNSTAPVPRNQLVCKAVSKVHGEITASATPRLPFILSEFNASWMLHKSEILDTTYMGPWLADTIRQCDGLVDMMSFWAFSDVFEEEGVPRKPFYGGFGIIAEDNIPKPSFNAFALLHKLGDTRLQSDSDSALITRRKDGTLEIALWNYAEPTKDKSPSDPAKTFELVLSGVSKHAKGYVARVDSTHGNVLPAYEAMGHPDWPTQTQIAQLQTAAKLSHPEVLNLKGGRLTIEVPARGLVLVEIR